MKKVLVSLGKAALYALLFVGMQAVVTVAYLVAGGAAIAARYIYSHSAPDVNAISNDIMEFVLSNTLMITAISGVLTLAVLWLVFAIRKRKYLREISLRPIPAISYIPLFIAGGALAVSISTIMSLLPIPEDVLAQYAETASALEGSTVMTLIASVVIAPVTEEVIFRGLIYTRLRRAMPPWVAMLVSSLVFGLMHGQIVWVIYASLIGVLLCAVFERTNSILATMVLHSSFNLFGGLILANAEITGFTLAICLLLVGGCWWWMTRIFPYTKLRPEDI